MTCARLILKAAVLAAGLVLSGCSSYRVRWQGVELPPLSARSRPEEDDVSRAARLNNLGVYLEERGDLKGALEHYRAALGIDPLLTVAYINAGNAHLRLGNLPSASSHYRRALEVEPDHPRALNNLAWVYIQQEGSADEAIALARRAIEADPGQRYLYLDTLGWALWNAGRGDDALEILEEAREVTPEEKTALLGATHYHLGVIYRERGEDKTARRHFRKSLEYGSSPETEREIRKLLGE